MSACQWAWETWSGPPFTRAFLFFPLSQHQSRCPPEPRTPPSSGTRRECAQSSRRGQDRLSAVKVVRVAPEKRAVAGVDIVFIRELDARQARRRRACTSSETEAETMLGILKRPSLNPSTCGNNKNNCFSEYLLK